MQQNVGTWQTGQAPKDGTAILGIFYSRPYVVRWDEFDHGEGDQDGWVLAGDDYIYFTFEPTYWARITLPWE
jgi:hypothetical protein